MRFTRGLLLGLLIGCVGAASASAAAPKRITFYFGLTRPEARAQKAFFAVQRPGSSTYRRFLSPGQVAARYGASPAVRSAFTRGVRRRGFSVHVDPTARSSVSRARWPMRSPVRSARAPGKPDA